MAKLIAKNCTVKYSIGTAIVDGTAATLATAVTPATEMRSFAKSVTQSVTVNTINLTALGDVWEQKMPTTFAGSITLELYVDGTRVTTSSMIGFPMKITVDVDGAGGATSETWVGMIADCGWGTQSETEQTESITINLGVAGQTTWSS